MHSYMFTVFTPTYNRRNLLVDVFESLQAQTYTDFEWLIVDDGSTDTTEDVIKQCQKKAYFPIRYIKQQNGGKHRAINRGIQEAQGLFFLVMDSDDICTSDAIAKFKYYWDLIPDEEKKVYSAVTALSVYRDGTIVGDKFPEDIFDSNSIELRNKYHVSGDKWGFHVTDVLKKFPFPEFENENFLTEAIVWNRIAQKYKTRYINEPLCIKEYRKDGLSHASIRLRIENPQGATLYYNEYQTLPVSLKNKVKSVINYIRFAYHSGKSTSNIIQEIYSKKWGVCCLWAGYVLYKKDLLHD